MISNESVRWAMLSILIFCTVFSVHASDVPAVKKVKKGGLPKSERWTEKNVEEYLDLPFYTTIDDIYEKLLKVKEIDGFLVNNKDNEFKKYRNDKNLISLTLSDRDSSMFNISIYDHESWNNVCKSVFSIVTGSVALWNDIPKYYSVEKDDEYYTITKKKDDSVKWHFNLKGMFVIGVESKFSNEPVAKTYEDKISKIDEVIRKTITFIGRNTTEKWKTGRDREPSVKEKGKQ